MSVKILFIAPTFNPDAFTGDNIYFKWVIDCVSVGGDVYVADIRGIFKVSDGSYCHEFPPMNLRSQKAAFIGLLFGLYDYYGYRFVPAKYWRNFSRQLLNDFDCICFNFIPTIFSFKSFFRNGLSAKLYALTHNFDLDVYKGWGHGGLLKKFLWRLGYFKYFFWAKKTLFDVSLISISDEDASKYHGYDFGCSNSVAPVAIYSASAVRYSFKRNANLKLCFMGSLSTPFNEAALFFFANKISPALSKALNFDFYVFGSSPSVAIKSLCEEMKWVLCPDLDNASLDEKLVEMDFAILPFEHTQGVKLKVMHFHAVGLPIIGTAVNGSGDGLMDFYENDFDKWIAHISYFLGRDELCHDVSKRAHLNSVELLDIHKSAVRNAFGLY